MHLPDTISGNHKQPGPIAAAAVSGACATIVYTAVMELDIAATGVNSNDIMLLGTLVTLQPRAARVIGAIAHAANGTMLGVIYGAAGRRFLPGPPWLRGLLFANIENGTLYTLARWENHHPGIAAGEVAPYWSLTAFLQSVLRHTIYGALLGGLEAPLRQGDGQSGAVPARNVRQPASTD